MGPVAWIVLILGVGGCTYDGVQSAGTLDVAITAQSACHGPCGLVGSPCHSHLRAGEGWFWDYRTNDYIWRGLVSYTRNIILSISRPLGR